MSVVSGTAARGNLGTQNEAPARRPGQVAVEMNLQTALKQARQLVMEGRLDDSAKLAVAILTKRPGNPMAVQIMAAIAEKKGKPDRAIDILRSSLTGRKTDALAQLNLCRLYKNKGLVNEAIAAGEAALSHGAVEVMNDLGDAFVLAGDNERALGMFERTIAMKPDSARAHLALSHALLMKGEFRAGWAEYEWRYRLNSTEALVPKFRQAQWNGMPLQDSTLMVVCEQGFGDCFQFARYLILAKTRVKRLIVGVSKELKPLIGRIVGPDNAYDRWEDMPEFQFQATLSSMPYIFGTTIDTIPRQVPYLKPDPEKVEAWKVRLKPFVQGRKAVGIVWHGRPSHANNAGRSAPLGALTPILESEDFSVVSLQVGAGSEQLAKHPLKSRVMNAAPLLKDFDDTAALMMHLDCVVTIDSSPAHLAGALGRKTLIMLPKVAEWRWLENRSDSPWYPTVELVRPRDGGRSPLTSWECVVAQVVERLKKL